MDKGVLEVSLEALEMIGKIADKATGGTASTAVTVIRVIVDLVRDTKDGKMDPIVARNEMHRLEQSMLDADQKADSALDKKFPSVE